MVPLKFYQLLCGKLVNGYGIIHNKNRDISEFVQCEKFAKVFESQPWIYGDGQMQKKHNTMVWMWAEKRLNLRSKQSKYRSKNAWYKLDISNKDWRYFGRIWPYQKEDLTSLERLQLKYQSN